MNASIINGTSKAGKPYEALQVKIGLYEARLFPSPAELAYIKAYLSKAAHDDFQED